MRECAEASEEQDEFSALLYSEFPDDDEEECDPIMSSFIEDMNNIERIGNVLLSGKGERGWFFDFDTCEYRQMNISVDDARNDRIMRAVSGFETAGVFA